MAGTHSRRHKQGNPIARRTFSTRHLLLLTLLIAPAVISSSAAPQAPATAPIPLADAGGPYGASRLLNDGKSNPELINRDTLTAQILATMAIPSAPSEKEERRMRSFIRRMALGSDDAQILRVELIRLHGLMEPIRQRLDASPNRVPLADLAEYRQTRLNTYARVLDRLSADGRAKLDQFIELQKRNVKVYARRPQI